MKRLGGILALVCVASAGRAGAQESVPAHLDLKTEWAVNGLLLSTWVLADLFKPELAPSACRWCDLDDRGRWDPPSCDGWARDTMRWDDTSAAATASDALVYAALPLAATGTLALAADGDWRSAADDATLVSRGVALAAFTNQLVKYTAGRRRPYAHAEPIPFAQNPDQNLSFYSGHTSLAFSLVVSTGLVLNRRDSRYAPWVFGVGLPAAAGVGALRVAADKHYLSDVLVGAVLGSAMSWLAIEVMPVSEEQ